VDETPFLGIGLWSSSLFIFCLVALRVSYRSEQRPMWMVVNPPEPDLLDRDHEADLLPRQLFWGTFGLAILILGAGTVLAHAGNSIAVRTGLSGGLVGLLFVALATSLPELSAITGAMRHKRYELAVGEVFGSNLFNLCIIFVVDAVSAGPPVIGTAGRFEAVAALLALLLTGIYVLGLIERRDRTVLHMGYDSIVTIILYGTGLVFLVHLSVQG
jgi:cation:H+ antiporter